MSVWATFAASVPAEAVDVMSDLLPIVGLLGGIALAVALASVVVRVLKGG